MQGQALGTFPSLLEKKVSSTRYQYRSLTSVYCNFSSRACPHSNQSCQQKALFNVMIINTSIPALPICPPSHPPSPLPPPLTFLSLFLSRGVITARPICTWSLIILARPFSPLIFTLLVSHIFHPVCPSIFWFISPDKWGENWRKGQSWGVTREETKMASRKRQEGTECSPLPTKQEKRQLRRGKKRASSNRQWRLLITALGRALSESPHLAALCHGVLRRRTHNQAFH